MLFSKTILVAALAATVSAQQSVPDSIQSVLLTAVPPASLAALANPTGAASVASEFRAGKTPSWWSALPASVQSYLIQNSPTGTGAAGSAASAASSIASSASSRIASASASLSSALNSASSVAGTASSAASSRATAASTSNPASKPTGGLVAAGVGAAGVLALAIGL